MNLSGETLRKTVKQFILNYQDKHPAAKKSLQVIANRTPASYTTIRQIMNDSLKSLSLKKAVEIISSLGGPSRPDEVLKVVNELQEGENDRFDHLLDLSFYERQIDQLFADPASAKIIWAAFSSNNIARVEVRYRWGKEGEERLDNLIEKGLLKEEAGVIKGESLNAGVSLKTTYDQLGIAYDLYDITHSVAQENWVSFQTNSVNMEFVKKFREQLRELFSKFCEQSSLEENRGDVNLFFGMIMDRYMEQMEKLQ